MQRKNQLTEKQSRERDISEAFKSYEQEVHPSGETLSEVHKLWRVKVVTTFMKAAVPLAKVELASSPGSPGGGAKGRGEGRAWYYCTSAYRAIIVMT